MPFEAATAGDVLVAVLDREPPPLARWREVPAELEPIVRKALCKDRDERYQTVGQLAADLEPVTRRLEPEAGGREAAPARALATAVPAGGTDGERLRGAETLRDPGGDRATVASARRARGETRGCRCARRVTSTRCSRHGSRIYRWRSFTSPCSTRNTVSRGTSR